MDINTTAQFAATPDKVTAMMTDPEWWVDVYRRIGATTSNITPTENGISLDLALPAPHQVQKIVGETLSAHQDLTWQAPAEDGSRQGELVINPKGMPAKAVGHASLAAGGPGSVVTYTGEFTISLPVVGKKLEKVAGPYLTRAFDVQQEAGDDYLSR
ncbi:DUF2505 domain-containing protein [Acidipropionibacterium virtanenii]|nr:DUF2505 domain-containing protein [Acidipropionibacterium virtanenii]